MSNVYGGTCTCTVSFSSSGAEANFYDELVGLPRHMLRPADDGEELGTNGEENEVGDKVRLLHPPHPQPCMLLTKTHYRQVLSHSLPLATSSIKLLPPRPPLFPSWGCLPVLRSSCLPPSASFQLIASQCFVPVFAPQCFVPGFVSQCVSSQGLPLVLGPKRVRPLTPPALLSRIPHPPLLLHSFVGRATPSLLAPRAADATAHPRARFCARRR